jgi:hypothetical protein
VLSPLLANAYLHYVFDLWAERWRRRGATGDMIMVRYADDLVVGFEHESDARRFWDAMRDRLREFSLSLHPDRLIEFGRYAAQARRLLAIAAVLDGGLAHRGSPAHRCLVEHLQLSRSSCRQISAAHLVIQAGCSSRLRAGRRTSIYPLAHRGPGCTRGGP